MGFARDSLLLSLSLLSTNSSPSVELMTLLRRHVCRLLSPVFPRSRRHFSLFEDFSLKGEEVIKNRRKKKEFGSGMNSRILRRVQIPFP